MLIDPRTSVFVGQLMADWQAQSGQWVVMTDYRRDQVNQCRRPAAYPDDET
jgi:hypothetical protein